MLLALKRAHTPRIFYKYHKKPSLLRRVTTVVSTADNNLIFEKREKEYNVILKNVFKKHI